MLRCDAMRCAALPVFYTLHGNALFALLCAAI
jgi:hypothetical protein